MARSYRYLFQLNTIKEKGDGNKFPLPFSLQQHHKRKRQHIAIIFFFSATPPHKKMTTHYHRLLLKHKENKTHKKTTTKKPREGRKFTLSSRSTFSFLALASALLFQTIFLKQKKKKHKEKKP
jgi:hypothetical protein